MSPSENSQPCPVSILVSLLSGPWTLYILWVLSSRESMRFGALSREIQGISTKVLTERLRMLEAEKIIYRDYKATIPPQVTYGLTDRGQELIGVIEQIDAIAQRWYGQKSTNLVK
ncbi:MAG: helix-turn-helix transcriptional regulator [Coleofasciculaceae cyanobacterium SM2_1_6]|nr:helix-turn-helix transcriptional regulator [Coleofasciculaceae cyanobacterium SM2_1_6]